AGVTVLRHKSPPARRARITNGHGLAISNKKERQTKAAPGAPATGPTEQHLADAPLRERGPSTASVGYKSQSGSGLQFSWKQLPDARASFKLSPWPVRPRMLWFKASGCNENPSPGPASGGVKRVYISTTSSASGWT